MSCRPKYIKTCAEITDKYKGFVLDQYGVLHNGVNPLPGAPELVRKLQADNKVLAILSNTSKRKAELWPRLQTLGFSKVGFIDGFTSGEGAWVEIQRERSGQKCLMLAWAEYREPYLDGLGIIPSTAEDADFVLAHGMDGILLPNGNLHATNAKLGDFESTREVLKRAAERDLPMLVANSDFKTLTADGGVWHMPGNFARIYNELGGETRHFGKPSADIYKSCVESFEKLGISKSEIICVGDSFHHDIKGACDAGLDVLFIAEGVHKPELVSNGSSDINLDNLEALCVSTDCRPTYYSQLFQ
eukprot:CFRG7809T1